MDMLFGTFRLIYWACVGLTTVITFIVVAVVGLLAFIGRATCWLLFENPQGRNISGGPTKERLKS